MPGPLKQVLVGILLLALSISAFLIRLDNFEKSELRSIDEIVYARMAKQILDQGPSGYNTIPYGKELADGGRDLPDYFFQPLFKHPPLFTFMLTLSMKIFGADLRSAEYVSLLFGVLMIPLIYWMGTLIFDRRIGFLAAFLTWIDPVSIICSQKIWMETTLSFFTVLSICFFIYGLKRDKNIFFIWSGCACGAAVLTKFTGILPAVIVSLYALIYDRQLFKNKGFLIGLMMPMILLVPWFGWNFQVYGFSSIQDLILRDEPHLGNLMRLLNLKLGLISSVLAVSIFLLFKRIMEDIASKLMPHEDSGQAEVSGTKDHPRNIVGLLLGVVLLVLMFKYIVLSLNFSYLPKTSWGNFGFRDDNTPFFYFQQLLKFSPLFFFSYLALFFPGVADEEDVAMVRLSAIFILAFFIFYRNYQSRYILPAIPLLILLSSGYILRLLDNIESLPKILPARTLRLTMMGLISYLIVKTYYVNCVISFPNDLCYF